MSELAALISKDQRFVQMQLQTFETYLSSLFDEVHVYYLDSNEIGVCIKHDGFFIRETVSQIEIVLGWIGNKQDHFRRLAKERVSKMNTYTEPPFIRESKK